MPDSDAEDRSDTDDDRARLVKRDEEGGAAASAQGGGASSVTGRWFYTMVGIAGGVLLSLIIVAVVVHNYAASVIGTEQVIVSENDDRAFAVVTLSNGLETLLVSDPQADKSAAAADVGSGSWHDPPTIEGLAHFTEHMVFLGTVQHPDEDGYQRYLSAHGGSSNAYTDSEHTNYYFSVDWRHLEGALERFSEFFVAPLLKASAASKEMNAIESEHHKNLQEDSWRMQQLVRTAGQPGTPVSRFSTGNLATLNKTGIAAALERFHAKHYVASNMRAAVLGRESLAELHALAERTFGKVPESSEQVAARRAQAASQASSEAGSEHSRSREGERRRRALEGGSTAAMPGSRTVGRRSASAASLLQAQAAAGSRASEPGAAADEPAPKGEGASSGRSAAGPGSPDDPSGPSEPSGGPAPAGGGGGAEGGSGDDGGSGPGEPSETPPDGAVTAGAARAATAAAEAADAKIRENAAKGLPAAGATVVVGDTWSPRDLGPGVVFPPSRLGRIIRWRPVGDSHSVSLMWPLPPQLASYRSDPTGHLASLLGDESEGSVLFRVKQELGVAESLAAGLELDASGFSLFKVSATLSPAAGASAQAVEDAMGKVVSSVFAYLAMLRGPAPPGAAGPNAAMATKWRWEERRNVSSAAFLFPSRGKAADIVSDASRAMHTVRTADLLHAPSRWTWDAVAVNETLHLLTPSRCVVMVGSQAFPDATLGDAEPIYGTKHASAAMSKEQIEAWSAPQPVPSLKLPARNPFVPRDLSVLPLAPDVRPFGPLEPYTPQPAVISDADLDQARDAPQDAPNGQAPRFRASARRGASRAAGSLGGGEAAAREADAGFPQGEPPLPPSGMAVWWRQDETFRKPVINTMLEIETPAVSADPRASVLTSLYLSAVDDHLQADSYRAQLAGYVYAVTKASLVPGLSVVAGGFTEGMPLWLTSVLGGLRSPELSQKRFDAHRGMFLQSLDNSERTSKPYARALYYFKLFTGENRFNIPQLRAAAKAATLEELRAHVKAVWSAVRVVMLVHGNVNATTAGALARIAARAGAGSRPLDEAAALEARYPARWIRGNRMIQRRVANPAEGDSAVAVLHQLGLRDDCFAGLEGPDGRGAGGGGGGEGADQGSLLQAAAGRRARRQEPSRAGRASKARGRDGEDQAQAVLDSGGGPREAEAAGEAVRRRECTVRDLASQILGDSLYQPAFEELRTKQQLGYLVFAGLTSAATMGAAEPEVRPSRLVHGAAPGPRQPLAAEREALAAAPLSARGDAMSSLYVVVQGPENSPALLDVRVTQFLSTVNTTLEALSATDTVGGGKAASVWQNILGAQTIAKRRKPLSLSDGTGAMWGEIAGRTFRFGRKQDELDVLAHGHLDISDVVSLFNTRVLDDSREGAGRLSVQVFGADVPFTTPTKAWEADAKKQPVVAGELPTVSAVAVNVTDADPINKRLA